MSPRRLLMVILTLCPLLSAPALAGPSDDFAITGHQSGHSLMAGEYEHSEAGTVGYVVVAVLIIIVGLVLGVVGMEPIGKGEWSVKSVVLVVLVATLGLGILALPLSAPIWLGVYYVVNGLVCFAQFKKGRLGIE